MEIAVLGVAGGVAGAGGGPGRAGGVELAELVEAAVVGRAAKRRRGGCAGSPGGSRAGRRASREQRWCSRTSPIRGWAPAGDVRLLREVPEGRGGDRGRAPPGHRHPAGEGEDHRAPDADPAVRLGARRRRMPRTGWRRRCVRAAVVGCGMYLWHGQFLSRDRACRALPRCWLRPSPGALAAPRAGPPGCSPPPEGDHGVPGQRGDRGFQRAGFTHRREARLGSFRLVDSSFWSPCTPSGERRDDGGRGAAVLQRHRRPRRLETARHVRDRRGRALCGPRAAGTRRGHRDRRGLDKTWAPPAIDALLG